MIVVDHVFALLQSDHAVFYPRWPFQSVASDGERIRRFAIRKRFHHRSTVAAVLLTAVLSIVWPIRAIMVSVRCTRRWGDEAQRRCGRSKCSQLFEQYWLAVRHCIPPVDYYRYEVYRRDNRTHALSFLHTSEAQSLFRWLNRNVDDHQAGPIGDKTLFNKWCDQHGLSAVPLIGTVDAGTVTLSEENSQGPQNSLFVKPSRGRRGEGTSIWERVPGRGYTDGVNAVADWSSLLAHLRSSQQDGRYVLQPVLRNDDRIVDLSGGGLSAIRIVTGKSLTGHVQCIAAAYKMSWRQQRTNSHGLFSAVDLESGQLARAFSYNPVCAGYNVHPDTDAQIEGRVIPDWQSAKDLAVRAHQRLEGFVFIGWDIAITSEGVVLLEGNSGWDVISMQKNEQPLMLNGSFVSICLDWLKRID